MYVSIIPLNSTRKLTKINNCHLRVFFNMIKYIKNDHFYILCKIDRKKQWFYFILKWHDWKIKEGQISTNRNISWIFIRLTLYNKNSRKIKYAIQCAIINYYVIYTKFVTFSLILTKAVRRKQANNIEAATIISSTICTILYIISYISSTILYPCIISSSLPPIIFHIPVNLKLSIHISTRAELQTCWIHAQVVINIACLFSHFVCFRVSCGAEIIEQLYDFRSATLRGRFISRYK